MFKSCISAFLMVLSTLASAGAPIKEITTVNPDVPQYSAADGTGFNHDLVRLVYEPRGIKVKTKSAPWNRAVAMVSNHRADMMFGHFYDLPWAKDKKLIYSKYPHGIEIVAALFLREEVPNWNGNASLENEKVAWPLGYDYHDFIDVKVNWSESPDTATGVAMLTSKRMRFYLDDKAELLDYLEQAKLDKAKYRLEVVLRKNLHLIFSQSERGHELARIYDERIAELSKTRALQELADKYKVRDLPAWEAVSSP